MRVVVVGAGVVGLAVSRELVRRGCEVTCLEAAVPMAARSAGSSRLLRCAPIDLSRVPYSDMAPFQQTGWVEWDIEFRALFARRRNTTIANYRQRARLVHPQPHRRLIVTTPGAWQKPKNETLKSWPLWPQLGSYGDRAGVIDAAATGRYLRAVVGAKLRIERVTRIDLAGDRVAVWTGAGRHNADHVVIAAGQDTPALAAQVGIETPSALAHQVQFTFGLRYREDEPPCWLDDSHSKVLGATFYLYPNGDDRVTIGAKFGDGLPWDMSRDEAVAHSLTTVRAYARDFLHGVGQEVLETVHGSVIPGLGDDVYFGQSGPVTAIWGNNLFMRAPTIGRMIAGELHAGDALVRPSGRSTV
jgi:glycine/D-amino acid oxidase-like deaminating enzyme